VKSVKCEEGRRLKKIQGTNQDRRGSWSVARPIACTMQRDFCGDLQSYRLPLMDGKIQRKKNG